MKEPQQKTDLLYSPRQIEIATFLAGPVVAIYMLVKNFNILEKHRISRNIKYIGTLLLVWLLIAIDYIPYDIPTAAIQACYLIFVLAILKKYHMTKEEIIMLSPFNFRSNWTVLLVGVLGIIIFIGIAGVLSIMHLIAADVGLLPMTDSIAIGLEELSSDDAIFWR